MSDVIDQRTVEMRFDNANFEQNVESSIESISRLKKNLDFTGSARGLEKLEESLGLLKHNFRNTKESAEAVTNSFDNLFKTIGNVYLVKKGVDAFQSLERTVKATIKSMSGVEQMKAGWDKYTMKTTSVQTIMAATGKSIDEVSSALEKLNWYTDETSYDFADMVNNIGKFTSSGIDLKDAVSAMEGISNWTATSGRDVAEARRVMYNLSQAISMGAVKMQDWKSVELANMGTKEFKETVIQTGAALGKLKKVGDDYYTTVGKKQKITTQNFSSTLSTGWFDSELLVATLKRYAQFTDEVYEFIQNHPEEGFDTVNQAMEAMREEAQKSGKEFDELGYKWMISAQEAKTFKDVINSVKDAVSTGWMNTFELIFGNYEQARHLWTDLANELYEVFAVPGNDRNDFLSEVLLSNYSDLKTELKAANLSIDEFETAVLKAAESNKEYESTLESLTKKYGNLSNALNAGAVPMEWINTAFEDLKKNGKDAEKTSGTLAEVQQIVKDTWNTNKYGSGDERLKKYTEMGYDALAMQKLVNLYTKKGKIELEDLKAVGIEAAESTSQSWSDFIEKNEELISSLDELSGRELLIGGGFNILKGMFEGVKILQEGLSEVFDFSPDTVKEGLKNFYKFSDKMRTFIPALVSPLRLIGVVSKKVLEGIFGETFQKLSTKFQNKFSQTFDNLYTYTRRVSKLFKSLEDSKYLNKFVTKAGNYFNKFVSESQTKIEGYRETLSNVFQNSFVGKKFGSIKRQWDKVWSEVNANGGNGFDTLIKAFKRFGEQWKELHGDEFNPFSVLWDGLKSDFDKVKEKLKTSKFGEKIVSIWDSISSTISNIFMKKGEPGSKVKGGTNKNQSLFINFIQNVEAGFNELKAKFNQSYIGKKLSAVNKALSAGFSTFTKYLGKGWSLEQSFSRARNSFQNVLDNLFSGGTKRNKTSKADQAAEKYSSYLKNNISTTLKGIKNALTGEEGADLLGPNDGFLGKVREKLSAFWNWAKPLLKTIAENFAKDLNLTSLSAFFTSLAGFNFSKVGKGVKDFFKGLTEDNHSLVSFFKESKTLPDLIGSYNFKNVADALHNNIEELIDAFSPLKDTKRELKARSILEFAAAIGIVAGALYLISRINKDDLIKAGITVGAIATVLVGIGFALKQMSNVEFTVALSGNAQIFKIIALILAISIALKNVGKAAKGIAEAVNLLINAVDKFSELAANRVKFGEAVRAVQDLILALGAATGLAGLGLGNLFGGTALTILAMASAVRLLYKTVEDFTAIAMIEPEGFEKAIDNLSQMMYYLGDAVMLAGLTGGIGLGAIGRAGSILAFALAIRSLQNAVITLAEIPAHRLKASADAISEMLYSLGNASFWSGLSGGFGSFGRAATIFAFGATIRLLANTIKDVISVSADTKRFAEAKKTITDMVWLISGITAVLGLFRRFGAGISYGQTAGIAALGLSIKLISSALIDLVKLNKDRLEQGRTTVAIIAGVIAGFITVLGVVNRFLKLNVGNITSAAAIVSFGTAIKSIADAVIKLSDIDDDKLKKGGAAVGQIALVVAFLTAVSGHFQKTGKFSLGVNFIALSAGLYAMGMAIEKLGNLDTDLLIKGGGAVAALSIVLSACITLMNQGAKVPAWTNALNIAAITGAVYVLADVCKTFASMNRNELSKAAIGVVGLLGAISSITKFAMPKVSDWKSIFGSLSLLVIAGTVSLIAEVAKTFATMEWPDLAKVGAAFAGMISGMWAISKFVKVGSGISPIAALKVVGTIVGILGALGAIYKIPFVKDLLTAGGDLLGKLGEAIGKFVGGIGAGASKGIQEALGALGSGLASFAENGAPFFDLMKSLDKFDLAATLTSLWVALGAIEFEEIVGRIISVFSKGKLEFTTLEAFGTGLQKLAPGVSALTAAMEGSNPADLLTLSTSLKNISSVAKTQSKLSGNQLETFAQTIIDSAGSLQEAITALNELKPLTNNANNVIDSLNTLANVQLPMTASAMIQTPLFTFFAELKESSFTDFANDLSTSVGALQTFINAANSLSFSYQGDKLKTTILAEMLQGMADVKVPPTNGLVTLWASYKESFTTFAGDLVAMMDSENSIKKFVEKVNELPNLDKTKFGTVTSIISSLASIVTPVNDETVFMSFSAVVASYMSALDQIDNVAEEIDKDQENIDKVKNLIGIFDSAKELDLTKLDSVPDAIKAFVDALNIKLDGITIDENIANVFEGLTNVLSNTDDDGSNLATIGANVRQGIQSLSETKDYLADAKAAGNFFSKFVTSVKFIQNGLASKERFNENLSTVIEGINEQAKKFNSKSLQKLGFITRLFESMQALSEMKFTKKDTSGMSFLEEAFTSLADAIDNFAPQTGYEELTSYVSWLESLSGKKETFKQAGEALTAFVPDSQKLSSLTAFINALKGDFLFSPGKTNEIHTFDGPMPNLVEEDGYFSKTANDLVEMNKILGEEDFLETDTVTRMIERFATALGQVKRVNADEIKTKFQDILTAISEAVLGDGSDNFKGFTERMEAIDTLFDPILSFFDSLVTYQENGTANIIPDILNGISTAIGNFTYDQNKLDMLRTAIQSIAEDLGLLSPSKSPGGKYNPLVNTKNSIGFALEGSEKFKDTQRQRPESKADKIAEKVMSAKEIDPSALSGFVDGIADAIERNSDKTSAAAQTIVDNMIEIFESYMENFIQVGYKFIQMIADGMEENSGTAIEKAATIATRILTKFTEAAETHGGETASKMVQSIATGLGSEDSKQLIDNAIKNLFGQGEDQEITQPGLSVDTQDSPGSQFAKQFVNDFTTSLQTTVGEQSEAITSAFSNLVSGISDSMSGLQEASENADSASNFISNIASGLMTAIEGEDFTKLETACQTIGTAFASTVPDGFSLGYSFVKGLYDGLVQGIAEYGGALSAAGINIGQGVVDSVNEGGGVNSPSWKTRLTGKYLCEGLLQGINRGKTSVYKSAYDLGDTAIDGTRNALDTHSPSKVFYEIGEQTVDGFANGIQNGSSTIVGTVANIADLTAEELTTIVGLLQNSAAGSIWYKGRQFFKKDIPYLLQFASSANKVAGSVVNITKAVETATDNHGSGSGGGGVSEIGEQAAGATKGVGQLKKALEETDKKIKIFGMELSVNDLKELFGLTPDKDGNYTFFGKVFSADAINDAKTELQDLIKGLQGDIDNVDFNLIPVIESGKGVKGSLGNLNIPDSPASTTGKIADKANSLFNEISAKKNNSDSNKVGNKAITFIQNNTSPKALSPSEVYRRTKNGFASMQNMEI